MREGWVAEAFARAEEIHRVGRVAFEAHRGCADPAVADDHGGDALRDFGEHLGSVDHAGVVMGVHVDEAGGEGEAFRLDCVCGGMAERWSDGDDATVVDGDVDELRVAACSVEHVCIADEGVAIHAG